MSFLLLLLFSVNCYSKTFTAEIWSENYQLYQKTLHMPFNEELASGTLDEEKFRRYIIQDYFYLQNYNKVYAILLAKSPNDELIKFNLEAIIGSINEMEKIHRKFFKKFNITKSDLEAIEIQPNTLLYINFLISTAILESFEVGLIATLPCWWIYTRIGYDIKKFANTNDNKYIDWINGYGDKPWEESSTKRFTDLIDILAKNTTKENRSKMKNAYKLSARMEYMFWDAAYNNIKWIN